MLFCILTSKLEDTQIVIYCKLINKYFCYWMAINNLENTFKEHRSRNDVLVELTFEVLNTIFLILFLISIREPKKISKYKDF